MFNEITQQLNDSGTTALVGHTRSGHHDLPQAMLDDYAAVEEYLAQHTTDRGSLDLNAAGLRHAQDLAHKAMAHTAWNNGSTIITDYLQPALDKLLAQVKADRKTAATWAMQSAASIDMLDQSDDVRAAIVRLHSLIVPYGALRTSWEVCRRRITTETTRDPLDVHSPLAEVANIPDLFTNWESASHARTPWPWPSNALHVKLGWLLDNGGKIWVPTPAQQTEAYHRYHPEPRRQVAA